MPDGTEADPLVRIAMGSALAGITAAGSALSYCEAPTLGGILSGVGSSLAFSNNRAIASGIGSALIFSNPTQP